MLVSTKNVAETIPPKPANADADAEQGTLVLGKPNFWVTEVTCLNPEFDLDFGLPALPRENEEKVKFPDWIVSFKCKNRCQGWMEPFEFFPFQYLYKVSFGRGARQRSSNGVGQSGVHRICIGGGEHREHTDPMEYYPSLPQAPGVIPLDDARSSELITETAIRASLSA
jgi:hypothetical protein